MINKKIVFVDPYCPWDLESNVLDQLNGAATHPFVDKIAVMPDVHLGYDLPIGGVALTRNVISPSFVGFDIGCGVEYARLNIDADFFFKHNDPEFVRDEIFQQVNVGVGVENSVAQRRRKKTSVIPFKSMSHDDDLTDAVQSKAEKQIGTLGGGNHFIELGKSGRYGHLCLIVHSGSRKPGYMIAEYYQKKHGEYLNVFSHAGQNYIHDMRWALGFAHLNRAMIMNDVMQVLGFDDDWDTYYLLQHINEPHNYASMYETAHSELQRWVHRKGAINAERGVLGVIPGDMSTGSYIVRGLGNPQFLDSASHGAGRAMSRSKAKKDLSMEDFREIVEGSEVSAMVDEKRLDESPMAYKDLENVISPQDGTTIEIVDHIQPVVNVKG